MAANKRKILEAARKHAQKGAQAKALKEYDKLLRLDPSDAKLRLEIGDSYRRWGQLKEAVETYRRVADQYMKEGFDARAVAVFKQIINLDADSFATYESLAELYQRMGLTSEAIGALQSAADGLYKQGKKPEALEILRKMANLDPTNTTSRLKVADLLRQEGMEIDAVSEYDAIVAEFERQGEIEGAARSCERILELEPDRPSTLMKLADLLLARGQAERAEPFVKRALDNDSDSADAIEKLADVYRAQGRDTELADTYRRLADLYRRRGDEDKAVEIIQRFVPPDTLDAEGVEELGPEPDLFGDEGLGRDEQPMLAEDQVVSSQTEVMLEEDDVLDLGDEVEAPASPIDPPDLSEAAPAPAPAPEPEASPEPPLELPEGEPEQLLAEASVYLRYGKRGQAIANLEAVILREPRLRAALEKLGEACADSGNEARAVELWQRAAAEAQTAGDSEGLRVLRGRIGALDPDAAAALDTAPVAPPETPEPPAEPEPSSPSAAEAESTVFKFDAGDTGAGGPAPPPPEPEIDLDDIEIDIDDASFDIDDDPAEISDISVDLAGTDIPDVSADIEDTDVPDVSADIEDTDVPDISADIEDTDVPDISADIEGTDVPDISADIEGTDVPDLSADIAGADVSEDPVATASDESPAVPIDAATSEDIDALGASSSTSQQIVEDLEEADFYMQQGLTNEAEEIFKRVLSFAPNHPHALVRLGEIAAARGDDPGTTGSGLAPPVEAVPQETVPDVPGLDLDVSEPSLDAGESQGSSVDGIDFELEPPPEDEPEVDVDVDLAVPGVGGDEAHEDAVDESDVSFDLDDVDIGDDLAVDFTTDEEPETVDVAADTGIDEPEDDTGVEIDVDAALSEPDSDTATLPEPPPEVREPDVPREEAPVVAAAAPEPEGDVPVKDRLPERRRTAAESAETGFDLAAELSDAFDDESGASAGNLGDTAEEGFEAVFAEFKKGVSETVDEGDYDTHYDLGIAYREMGLFEDAAGEFRAAMGSPEKLVECLRLMGLCALELDRPDEAVGHFQQVLEADDLGEQQQLATRLDLGRALEARGDVEGARGSYEAVAAVDPSFCDVQERIEALAELEKPDAEAQAEEAEDPAVESFETFDDLVAEANDAEDEDSEADDPEGQGPEEEVESFESFDDVMDDVDEEDSVEEESDPVAESQPEAEESEPEAEEPEPDPDPDPEPEASKKRRRKKISFV